MLSGMNIMGNINTVFSGLMRNTMKSNIISWEKQDKMVKY